MRSLNLNKVSWIFHDFLISQIRIVCYNKMPYCAQNSHDELLTLKDPFSSESRWSSNDIIRIVNQSWNFFII